MCVLIVGFRVYADWPLVVAANRDEFFARPSAPPRRLDSSPRIFGGLDLRGGGTWLGVNELGVVSAVTNRYLGCSYAQVKRRTSRGQLCLRALRAGTAHAAARVAWRNAVRAAYSPFNLVVADIHAAFHLTQAEARRPSRRPLEPGWHVVANGRLDDARDPRVGRAISLLPAAAPGNEASLVGALARICRDHGDGAGRKKEGLCRHGDGYGTRSSTIILVQAGGRIHYAHADGPPCTTRHAPMTLPFGGELPRSSRHSKRTD